jgi:hypothetical protein
MRFTLPAVSSLLGPYKYGRSLYECGRCLVTGSGDWLRLIVHDWLGVQWNDSSKPLTVTWMCLNERRSVSTWPNITTCAVGRLAITRHRYHALATEFLRRSRVTILKWISDVSTAPGTARSFNREPIPRGTLDRARSTRWNRHWRETSASRPEVSHVSLLYKVSEAFSETDVSVDTSGARIIFLPTWFRSSR